MLRINKKIIIVILLLCIPLIDRGINALALNELRIILKPVAIIVGYFKGIEFRFEEGIGYINDINKIIIAKECAGIKFMLIAIALLMVDSFCLYNEMGSIRLSKSVVVGFVMSYITTIVANACRIIILISIEQYVKVMFEKMRYVIHMGVGVVIYVSFLIGLHMLWVIIMSGFKRGYSL